MSRLKKFLEQDNNAEAEGAADDGFEEGKGGMTSRDFEHNHRYTIDDDGNGETTEDGEDRHSHTIKGFEMQPAGEEGHNHTLKMEENIIILEKWAKKVKIQQTGEHAPKSVGKLKKEITALKGKPGNKEKMGELLFALRSKGGWKKGKGAAGLGDK